MGFETKENPDNNFLKSLFQSSFSEYGLWNVQEGKRVIVWQKTFNPRFLSMGFETEGQYTIPSIAATFQSSFSEYGLWNCRGDG